MYVVIPALLATMEGLHNPLASM